jgi:hypothetical protein
MTAGGSMRDQQKVNEMKALIGLFFYLAMPLALSCPSGQTWNDCLGPQFGPGGCIPGCVGTPNNPVNLSGPSELCILNQCKPVTYYWVGAKVVAESWLPNGYEVLGWSGPCLNENFAQCPDIFNQAFADLRMNALRANRAQNY